MGTHVGRLRELAMGTVRSELSSKPFAYALLIPDVREAAIMPFYFLIRKNVVCDSFTVDVREKRIVIHY
jgi:hypothetical protein